MTPNEQPSPSTDPLPAPPTPESQLTRKLLSRQAQQLHQQRKRNRVESLEAKIAQLEQQRGTEVRGGPSNGVPNIPVAADSYQFPAAQPHGNRKPLPFAPTKLKLKQLPASERRTIQNRISQRASRERAKRRVQELEEKLRRLSNAATASPPVVAPTPTVTLPRLEEMRMENSQPKTQGARSHSVPTDAIPWPFSITRRPSDYELHQQPMQHPSPSAIPLPIPGNVPINR
ncbi:hypothetical protein HDU98_005035, partial [Podochytrium sp. JEL0797]